MKKILSSINIAFFRNIGAALFILLFAQVSNAQGRWSTSLKLANQKDGIYYSPGQLAKIHCPLNPVISIDIQRNYLNTNRSRLYQSVYATYAKQTYIDQAFVLGTALGYEFRIFKGLYLGANIGGGINRNKATDIVYNLENGKWVAAKDDYPAAVGGQFQGGGELGYRVGKFNFFAHGQYSITLKQAITASESYPWIFRNAGIGVRMGL